MINVHDTHDTNNTDSIIDINVPITTTATTTTATTTTATPTTATPTTVVPIIPTISTISTGTTLHQHIVVDPLTNNWNDQDENTLRSWKTSLVQYLHIYQFVLDSAQTKMNRVLFAVEILGVFASILATISAGALGFSKLSSTNTTLTTIGSQATFTTADIIAFVISILVAIINLIITLLNRLIKIYKWDTTITTCASYITSMDQIYSTISVELSLPRTSRSEASKFIKDNLINYLDLIKNSPNIDLADQETAMIQYERFIKGKIKNFHLTQKYAKEDNDISVI